MTDQFPPEDFAEVARLLRVNLNRTETRQGNRGCAVSQTYKEEYLGDGVYAADVGDSIRLRAPRPGGDHLIYLEASHLQALATFAKRMGWVDPNEAAGTVADG